MMMWSLVGAGFAGKQRWWRRERRICCRPQHVSRRGNGSENFVACANIIPAVESLYFWKDKVEQSAEVLVIFKLTAARFTEFSKRLQQLHPYDVPEIIRLNVSEGSPDYLRWISESCSRRVES